MKRILVWDWPTRLIHWLLVALVFFSWGSAEYGHMNLHRYSGYTILGLLLFRFYWGFFGSETARFAHFIRGPRAIADYFRSATKSIGHNPLGALSVVALLALLVTQVVLGLFAVDVDGIESGPLSAKVSFETGRALAKLHHKVFDGLLVLIALHVVAILLYLVIKRDNLVTPMLTGKKSIADDAEPVSVSAPILRVVIGMCIAGSLVWLIV